MSDEKKNGSRWWEFYAIRYGMGTVIGAVIFYFLCSNIEALKSLIDTSKGLSATNITLLAAFGLTFCFLSSGPILVLHATRFLLERKMPYIFIVSGVILGAFSLLLAFLILKFSNESTSANIFYISIIFFGAIVAVTQWVFIFEGLRDVKGLVSFYRSISEKRSSEKTDIVESYRHLREHGNSFFIVVCEIILAGILYGVYKIWFTFGTSASGNEDNGLLYTYLIIISIWVFPAVMIWLVATRFEIEYKRE